MHSLLLALQFLTRIPLPVYFEPSERQWGHSVLFYPFVGLLIGLMLVLALGLLGTEQPALKAAMLLILWVGITGGLHLDGLADCADAWAGGMSSPERSLAIMKDPAAGPIAVIWLILVLMVKWAALVEIVKQSDAEALLMVPMLGRLAIMALMLTAPYVRPGGLGEKMIVNLPVTLARLSLAAWLICAIWFAGWMPVLVALLVWLAIRYLALRRLGGVTGDVYGAAVELSEAAVLAAVAMYV
ncbi:adenosylcobinamide-GDP ribazoletransferase [Methylicorpusculum oleiharenae]|uniref:adenosylcobinamide-GDP ribazoletransferase n=1 Tax=Methylicorpusculum oleiharenae TaxID=1338687 RepID=UPI00135BF4C8|nr:adenosylcobinamide-GDP ribazoletransferase [Methylicorpusculum oleiharenae]MCD2450162.1 adenosylcobinamide-GDP ribazoletransferase [Methylicorpusculum oleiharenae]